MKFILISLLAIVSLQSFKPNENKYINKDPLAESIARGKEVYTDFCINCHMANGEGIAGVFPPLAASDYLMSNREASIRAIKYGLQGEIVVKEKTYNSIMVSPGLENDEIADVMNYITNSWGNKNDKMVTEKEVSKVKK